MSKCSSGRVFNRVYQVVKTIPRGRVATYGQIADKLGVKDARIVGWALHGNADPQTPCHRVVNRMGFLAKNYAFGGDQEQRLRLKAEGVLFINEHRVNLDLASAWRREKREGREKDRPSSFKKDGPLGNPRRVFNPKGCGDIG